MHFRFRTVFLPPKFSKRSAANTGFMYSCTLGQGQSMTCHFLFTCFLFFPDDFSIHLETENIKIFVACRKFSFPFIYILQYIIIIVIKAYWVDLHGITYWTNIWTYCENFPFLQVKQDEFFPADLLLLASTNVDGVCYIEVITCSGSIWCCYFVLFILFMKSHCLSNVMPHWVVCSWTEF